MKSFWRCQSSYLRAVWTPPASSFLLYRERIATESTQYGTTFGRTGCCWDPTAGAVRRPAAIISRQASAAAVAVAVALPALQT